MALQINSRRAADSVDAVFAANAAAAYIGGIPESRSFVAMLAAFRATGGTARGDDLARLLVEHQCGDFVSLARCLAAGKLFCFQWRGCTWIPMFQFELADLSIKSSPHRVRDELPARFSGWAQAAWFARKHDSLDGHRPVDMFGSDFSRVIDAAREETPLELRMATQ